jgi:hypothetical protein
MYRWDTNTQCHVLQCDDGCGSEFGVQRHQFKPEEWNHFGPEELLMEKAVQAKWQHLFDAKKNQVVLICKNCVDVRIRQ